MTEDEKLIKEQESLYQLKWGVQRLENLCNKKQALGNWDIAHCGVLTSMLEALGSVPQKNSEKEEKNRQWILFY